MALTGKAENFTESEAREYLKANGLDIEEYPKMLHSAMKTDGRARACMFKSIITNQSVDEVETLKNVKIPVLLLGGQEDAFVNYDYVKEIQWSSLVETQIIEREDHSFVWNNSKLFNTLMMKHLSKNHTNQATI